MAYAAVSDMIARFGAAEMTRATTPDGVDATAPIAAPIQQALDDASALIDTYLRSKYRVPLDVPPVEISRACCMLARYDLAMGGERSPNEQTEKSREETIDWLKRIARGDVKLDLTQVATGDESYATMQMRQQVFGDQNSAAADGCGGFWNGGGIC